MKPIHKRIIILGGGIAGLAMANFLQKNKIDFLLFEKTKVFGDVGAGIGLTESTLGLLSQIISLDDLMQKGQYIKRAIIVDKHKKVIKKIPMISKGVNVQRPHLISTLVESIESSRLYLDHELKSLDQQNQILEFINGEKYSYDCLIACDGIQSKIRQALFPQIKPRYSGQTVWRGIAKMPSSEITSKDTYFEYWGDNLRFATIPLSDELIYWYAVAEAQPGAESEGKNHKAKLMTLFANYSKDVEFVLKATDNIIRNDMFDIKPQKRPWSKGSIVLIGDAIHATTPNMAQGACQAIEDAATLAKCLKKNPEFQTAFTLYESLRQKKVNEIVKQSWSYGKMSHQNNILKKYFVSFLFKYLLPKGFFLNQYKKLIDIDYIDKI